MTTQVDNIRVEVVEYLKTHQDSYWDDIRNHLWSLNYQAEKCTIAMRQLIAEGTVTKHGWKYSV
jgi:hypothetical protein